MKEHIQAEMVSELRDIAVKYHAHEPPLCQIISECVDKYMVKDFNWKNRDKPDSTICPGCGVRSNLTSKGKIAPHHAKGGILCKGI